ncbi:hypothetical protein T265_05768 [Opisthorchis viverrini]|uniref:Uncharacterized protein n=1 Tax=Opisthorchis viverrini TaxID=6198 RepID=A0A074ZN62_OPIVI|nr:hypothetical protein T265_05768 [Opisthorchis viverrini]KER27157.1 hypothetical protein T265_05768 [Opisthorchis viverrini]
MTVHCMGNSASYGSHISKWISGSPVELSTRCMSQKRVSTTQEDTCLLGERTVNEQTTNDYTFIHSRKVSYVDDYWSYRDCDSERSDLTLIRAVPAAPRNPSKTPPFPKLLKMEVLKHTQQRRIMANVIEINSKAIEVRPEKSPDSPGNGCSN